MTAPGNSGQSPRESQRQNQPPIAMAVAAYVVAILFLLGMMIFLIAWVWGQSSFGCPPGSNVLPDPAMLIVAFWALVAGRWLGGRRFAEHWKQAVDRRWKGPGAAGYLLLTAVAFLGLLYEAVGVQQESPPQLPALAPITQYTRCAIYYDKQHNAGALTYAVLIIICLLVGSWLWADHPHEHFADHQGSTTP
jgi:hypothetical protein